MTIIILSYYHNILLFLLFIYYFVFYFYYLFVIIVIVAPEVLRSDCLYGLPADVFSFGILSWEIFSTTPQANPLKGLDPVKAVQNVSLKPSN